ncbi:methyl-accepting chemotaxis protein [Desulfofustis limnaeus]|uniref:HAMP domain-containing protein n=1 Tax=Desulfofustis limnaeus TaxID=2740163 RepID=A0ABM7W9V6_9BACT|nr:methyl-accepting chemotaxis protein [Desulfofustis limnaeus]BDD87643.1 hypothetical protein DPPLL_20080 [Desulfofustis limnaeus]
MAAHYQRKLKNFFIKKDFQGRISLAVFLAVVGGCFIFFVLLAFFSRNTLTFSYTDSVVQVGQTPWMLIKNALLANWLFLLVGGSLLVVAAIIATHRVAGPLFRFEKTLGTMIDGDLSQTVHLRDKDEGKDLAARINSFNLLLTGKLREIDRSSKAISDLLARCEALDLHRTRPEETDEILQAIKRHTARIRTQVDYFTLKHE